MSGSLTAGGNLPTGGMFGDGAMNLAGYIRVSTEGQVDAYGKDVQRQHIVDWANLNDHKIVAWFEEDGVSGKTDGGDRPALSEILERSNEFEGVVFFDPTRIARRVVVQETLLGLVWANGLTVFTTTTGEMSADEEDPTKILIRQILSVIAEFDHRTIVRRMNAGRKAKSAQGGFIGGTPKYGTSVVGTGSSAQFIEDAVESSVVKRINEMRFQWGQSYQQIASALNDNNILTKRGKQWRAMQVQRIIQRVND